MSSLHGLDCRIENAESRSWFRLTRGRIGSRFREDLREIKADLHGNRANHGSTITIEGF